MKIAAGILLVCVLVYVGYEFVRLRSLIQKGTQLVAEAQPFTRAEGVRTILVVGDSTAAGVGASNPAKTVAGRLSIALDASVANLAKSGAVTADVAGQIAAAQRSHYDLVLIQVGANDIIHFYDLSKANDKLEAALADAKGKSDHVVLLTAGKVGEAPLFPQLFGWIWTKRAAQLRQLFLATAQEQGVGYVDLFNASDPFSSDPDRYYASDGLHLTDDGYGFWYDEVKKAVQNRWPELLHDAN